MIEELKQILTAKGSDLVFWQMVVRGIIIYGVMLVLVRMGKKRFLGENSPIDIVLVVILGSMASRAINGSGYLVSTMVTSAALVFLHSFISHLTVHFHRFGSLVKGNVCLLAKDSNIDWAQMRKSALSEKDLEESVRLSLHTEGLGEIQSANLERNGHISLTRKPREPKILEVAVAEGVQTVRIEV